MPLSRMDLQRHYDRRVAIHSQPDLTPVEFAGKRWIRARPLVCPWCGVTFYDYLPEDADPALWPEHCVDPETEIGGQRIVRATCGHPLCWEAEDRHQRKRRGVPEA